MTAAGPDGGPRPIRVGRWRIDVERRPGVPRIVPHVLLARGMAAALDAAGTAGPASVGLVLADDAELARLNAGHLGVDGPTDVLSFPLLPPDAFPAHEGGPPRQPSDPATGGPTRPAFVLPPGRRLHLGDVVVSVERAIEQARSGRGGQTGDVHWGAADELKLLVVHGTLHLCGWDHADRVEERAMRRLERTLLETARG